MPIRQEQMLEQMQEARLAHTYGRRLRELVQNYISLLPSRYPNNPAVQEIIEGLGYAVKLLNLPDDRVTWDNERYYARHARMNSKYRARQEMERRARGIPTREEAIVTLHAQNELRSQGLLPETYEEFNRGGRKAPSVPFSRAARPATTTRQKTIMPRDYDDDPELEFETPEELAPIANLPAGAVDAIVDPLGGENNSKEGIDNPVEQAQDSNGNDAEEQGQGCHCPD